ncbi:glycoside hydrolase family 3 N-terminal domain-containing protein [Qipengyuania sp. RANM35]|uniref:glycoside hydrolase family 3 protein n=1 Tax=Qipengyuania sp. RANM35 TaxID=3068635 RepID=UPI0034DB6A06
MKVWLLASAAGLAVAGCSPVPTTIASAPPPAENHTPVAYAANWPEARSPAAITDAATETAIDALIAKMTLAQKVGQVIQADISAIQPHDLRKYPLGSILAGGNSGPNGNDRASAAEWDALVRAFRKVSMEPRTDGVAIPILFGVDAVHGHNNIPGATVFPHNVGLGATHDPELIGRIGAVTAAEIAGSGIEWTFAPTLAVPQDGRWGRAYEGYSSNPAIVAAYSAEMVRNLQGPLAAGKPLADDKVAATAKHFLADGGTEKGQDQGDARISEEELVRIHNAGYPPAIDAGTLTVMASFSSWNGAKHHGNKSLLTDALKGRMGFEGLVVGDWNAHGQVPGCEPTDCPQALEAGLDLYMAPDSWKGLYENTLKRAEAGEIPMDRLEDAIRRILRVKFKLGLMDGQPDTRGNLSVIGSPAHLAVAREAVAKSLVLLKNEGSALPVKPGAKVLVTGPGADDMAMQSGGWTIGWQGTDVTKADFPNGQTIWEGLSQAVRDAGGQAALSKDGSYSQKPDVAIVVFGETPYAEFQGDRPHLDFTGEGLATIEALKAKGIPVVSVFLSGRPLFVGPEMDASDAFVAAWLPGSQAGSGIAEVLVADRNGRTKRDFTGTLSFAWPAGCEPGAETLFPLGFGGSYTAKPTVPALATTCSLSGGSRGDGFAVYDRGLQSGIWAFTGDTGLVNLVGSGPGFKATAFDIAAQEDARRLTWTAPASLQLRWDAQELPQTAALTMRVSVAKAPASAITLKALGDKAKGPLDLTPTMKLVEGKGMRDVEIPLACIADGAISGVEIASAGAFVFELETIGVVPQAAQMDCTGPF